MPKHAGYVLSRLENFAKGAKRLLEHLSPRKTCKRPKLDASNDSGQGTVSFIQPLPHFPAGKLLTFFQNSISGLISDEKLSDLDEDIFSSSLEKSSNLGQFYLPQMATREPTEALQTFYSEFSLPPICFPKATVEDCDDDDCDFILVRHWSCRHIINSLDHIRQK